jgi:triphosphoribosyl-dephospho-CoA synthase
MRAPLAQRIAHAKACFVHACRLDVAVRKPGNVSLASSGHGMQAQQFLASAQAAAGPLFAPGARVGARIEAAMAASWKVVGCNTNLGILLLCAPVACAVEREGSLGSPPALRGAIESVLADLGVDDARAAYRAISRANPGGLGVAPEQDVNAVPSLDLRAAMGLAAGRDRIASQYANGYADLFDAALPLLWPAFLGPAGELAQAPDPITTGLVQRTYLLWLGRFPDSHIVRKHGEAVAHTVMRAAQAWSLCTADGADPAWAEWDESLKAQRINPGTSADLTVAAMLLAGLLAPGPQVWHGS